MEISINDIEETKKEIKVVVPFEEFKKFIGRAEKEIIQNFETKGFRKGQAPREMVIQEIGQSKILEKAAHLAVEAFYPQVIKEAKLDPLGSPELDILKLAPNNPLEFRVRIFIMPEIKLPDYSKIAGQFKRQEVIVKTEEIEQAFKQLQEMKDKIPEEHRDKIDFSKPEELKQTLRKQIEKEKELAERQRIRGEILDGIVKGCSWSVPEILILREKHRAMEDLKRKVSEVLKMSFKDYLEKVKKTEKELEESLIPEVTGRIKKTLILREIQKKEKIEVSEEELKEEIDIFLKHPANQKVEKSIDQVALKGYLKERMEQEKILQFLEKISN